MHLLFYIECFYYLSKDTHVWERRDLCSGLLRSDNGCGLCSRDLDVVCSHCRNTSLISTLVDEIGEHLSCQLVSRRTKEGELTSIVSNGPPADSGWNWTPQILFPDSGVEMIPSTEESLQLIKNGAHPSGNDSVNRNAY